MYKKLARHGNSSALVLERPILELLNITDTTQLKITTDGTSLIITPMHQKFSEPQRDEVLKPFENLMNSMPHSEEARELMNEYAKSPTPELQRKLLQITQ